jgi:DNA-binding beta-propeller fold protein YncE
VNQLSFIKTYFLVVFSLFTGGWAVASNSGSYLSPTALAATGDGQTLFIACANSRQILYWDVVGRKVVHNVTLPLPPSGLTLSPDNARLYVTCAAPESRVCVVDVASHKIVGTIQAGHTAQAPVLSPDGQTLYVCNQFDNDVSVIDLGVMGAGSGKHVQRGLGPAKTGWKPVPPWVVRRIPVQREPVAAAITPDGQFLLVANQLHAGRADVDYVAAVVSVIDTARAKVVKELLLPNGSGSLKDLRVSPDGRYAAVTHLIARYKRTPARVDRGWMHVNAVTIILPTQSA